MCIKRIRKVNSSAFTHQLGHIVVILVLMLIGSACIFWSFQLNFQSFHSNLKTIHSLNSCLSTCRIVKWHETYTNAMWRRQQHSTNGWQMDWCIVQCLSDTRFIVNTIVEDDEEKKKWHENSVDCVLK